MSRKKQEPVEEHNIFVCECGFEGGAPEIKTHLQVVHGIGELKGKRSMRLHMDGSNWFSYIYDWEIGSVKLTQSIRQKRSKEDQMHWGGGKE